MSPKELGHSSTKYTRVPHHGPHADQEHESLQRVGRTLPVGAPEVAGEASKPRLRKVCRGYTGLGAPGVQVQWTMIVLGARRLVLPADQAVVDVTHRLLRGGSVHFPYGEARDNARVWTNFLRLFQCLERTQQRLGLKLLKGLGL